MNPLGATVRRIAWCDLSLPLVVLGLALYVAGLILLPPHGGLLVIAGLLCAWLVVRLLIHRPGLFLALFLLFAVISPLIARLTGIPLGWLKGTAFIGLMPVWLLSRLATRGDRPWWCAARIPLLATGLALVVLGLLAILSVLRHVPVLPVINAFKGHLLYVPIVFLALDSSGDVRATRRFLWWLVALLWVVTLGAVVQSLVGLAQLRALGLSLETGAVAFAAIDPISGQEYQRVFSTLDDQIALASFCFVGIALCTYLWSTDLRRGRRVLLAVTLALCLYALVMTFNMTVTVGTALFFLLLAARARNPRLLAALVIGFLIVGVVAWLQVGELLSNRLVSSFSLRQGLSTSLLARVQRNANALELFEREPLIGMGLGSTASSYIYYKFGLVSRWGGGIGTDNVYMTVALESGLVGLAVVVLLYAVPLGGLQRLRRSADPRRRALGLIGGTAVIVMLLMNFSNGMMRTNPSNLVYWAAAGWAWREAWEERRRQEPGT